MWVLVSFYFNLLVIYHPRSLNYIRRYASRTFYMQLWDFNCMHLDYSSYLGTFYSTIWTILYFILHQHAVSACTLGVLVGFSFTDENFCAKHLLFWRANSSQKNHGQEQRVRCWFLVRLHFVALSHVALVVVSLSCSASVPDNALSLFEMQSRCWLRMNCCHSCQPRGSPVNDVCPGS